MSTVSVRSVVSCTQVVRDAIKNTSPEYWDKICKSRSKYSYACSGSYLHLPPALVSSAVNGLEWEHYTHDAVKAPATAFIARHVPGFMNVCGIDAVPPDAPLFFEKPKKEEDEFECVWKGDQVAHEVDFLVIIVGPWEGKDVVYTFHPGDPVVPSSVTGDLIGHLDGDPRRVTKEEAKRLGVRWVKGSTSVGTPAAL